MSASGDPRFRILRMLEAVPNLSQRQIADRLGISSGGRVNYLLRALAKKGQVKGRNFRGTKNKLRYAYLLTPRGLEEKTRLTTGFIRSKMAEYEALRAKIEALEQEMARGQRPPLPLLEAMRPDGARPDLRSSNSRRPAGLCVIGRLG